MFVKYFFFALWEKIIFFIQIVEIYKIAIDEIWQEKLLYVRVRVNQSLSCLRDEM